MTRQLPLFKVSDPPTQCALCSWGHVWRRMTDGARGIACQLFKQAPCDGLFRARVRALHTARGRQSEAQDGCTGR